MLPVVALVGLSDAFPSPEVILNVTVFPDAGLSPSVTLTVNVNESPGSPDPGKLATLMINGGGGGGGDGVLDFAVTLTDALPADAVIVYEPVALLPNLIVAEARPLLLVVVLRVVAVPT